MWDCNFTRFNFGIKKKFKNTLCKIAALEMQNNTYSYTDEVTYFFETDNKISYTKLIIPLM
jgi:hypothetical protein